MIRLVIKQKQGAQQKENRKNGYVGGIPVWLVGLVLGVGCLVMGALNEQFADIYRKAIMICLECIGIG